MNFGSIGGGGGGILEMLQSKFGGGGAAAPAVPSDGAMQPTIGPGTAPAAASASFRSGLPQGGLIGMMQGKTQPQGIAGLLQQLAKPAAAPAAAVPQQAGMLNTGMPGSPFAGPVAPGASSAPGLPLNIDPTTMF